MKAYHQTSSRNEHNSRSSSSDRKSKDSQLKKPLKNAKKNWNGAFTSTAPDVLPEIIKESTEFSPVSEISEANQSTQTPLISVLALNPAVSAPTDASSVSDVTPTSKISTITDCGLNKQCSLSIGQVEGLDADILVSLLKEARNEVLSTDTQSKKILDALIKVVIDEYYTPTEEKDLIIAFITMKWRVVCLCFFIWSFAVSMFLLFGLGSGSSAGGPFPT